MIKILVGIPTQEMARAAVFYDYIDLLEKPAGVELMHTRSHGQSPARNRNLIIQQAIESNVDYIFFVDDDCILPPPTLKNLLAHNVDCVTGLYVMRNYPHRPIIFNHAEDNGACAWYPMKDGERGLVEIVATGMGCLLTKIDVFKKIKAAGYKHWVTLGELEEDHWCDDLAFFKRVRAVGVKIHCDLNSPVGHVAKTTLWPNIINNQWHITYDTEGPNRISFPLPNDQQYSGTINLDERLIDPKFTRKMRSPSILRGTNWRRGVMQIHITNVCNLTCPNCTQGCNLATYPESMSLEQFERAVVSVKDYYGVIGVYGGNPTMHHQFPQICEILRKHIPFEQRGLFTNGLSGHGAICRETFNPAYSNLNIHADMDVYKEFQETWPEAVFNVKGFNHSRHTPTWVAIKDIEDMTQEEKWEAILSCDINKYWSAMIGMFRGDIRAWFCEIAGAQSRLHEHDKEYPDTGLEVKPGWWKKPIEEFEIQVNKHCWDCGIPLRGQGEMDNGRMEFVSKTHLPIYKLKKSGDKELIIVESTKQLGKPLDRITDYIENGQLAVQ